MRPPAQTKAGLAQDLKDLTRIYDRARGNVSRAKVDNERIKELLTELIKRYTEEKHADVAAGPSSRRVA